MAAGHADVADFSRAELMAVVISRFLRDHDVVLTGTNAAIPTAAYRLAQSLHAPGLVSLNGAHGTVDQVAREVPFSSADPTMIEGRFNIRLADVVGLETRRILDVVFLGALQVDQSGRLNLALIGDPKRPRLRGPGTLGLPAGRLVDRSIIYLNRHDPRIFVPEVDFVSVEAMRGGGLEAVVTPLAVFEPSPDRARLRLSSVHPGVSPETVAERTGFEVDTEAAATTAAPSVAELEALRAVDPDSSLRSMTFEERKEHGQG